VQNYIIKNGQGYITGITDKGQLTFTQDPKEARLFSENMVRIFWGTSDPNYRPILVEAPTDEPPHESQQAWSKAEALREQRRPHKIALLIGG